MKKLFFVAFVAVMAFVIGCGGGGSGGGESGMPMATIFESTPKAYPSGFLTNTSTTVRFEAEFNAVAMQGTANLRLYRLDDDQNPIGEPLCVLRDSGNVDDGDDVANDGIFSCKVEFLEFLQSEIKLAVIAQSDDVNASSSSFIIEAIDQLTDEEISVFMSTQEKAGRLWDDKFAQFGDTKKAREEAVVGIKALEGVADAGIDGDDTNIWIEYESGIGGGLYLMPPSLWDVELLNIDQAPPAKRVVNTKSSVPCSQSVRAEGDMYVGNKKVLIWISDDKVDIKTHWWLRYSNCPKFEIDILREGQCTVESIRDFTKYGTVIINAHGGQTGSANQIAFMTGEQSNKQSLKKYSVEIKQNIKRLLVYNGARLKNRKDYFIATNNFISDLLESFPDSIIFAGSCFSYYNDNMANAFYEKGAKAFFGNTEKTFIGYMFRTAEELFTNLVDLNMSVGEAYDKMIYKEDNGSVPRIGEEGIGNKFVFAQNKAASDLKYKCRKPSVRGVYIEARNIDAKYDVSYESQNTDVTHHSSFPIEANATVSYTDNTITEIHNIVGRDGNHYEGNKKLVFGDDFESLNGFTANAKITFAHGGKKLWNLMGSKKMTLTSSDKNYREFKVKGVETCQYIDNMFYSRDYGTWTESLVPPWSCNKDSSLTIRVNLEE